jgi:hypothetical protein
MHHHPAAMAIKSMPFLAKIRGFIPFYKEAGVSYTHVRDWLRLHFEEETGSTMKVTSTHCRIAKCPDVFSSGICFILMGSMNLCKHDKYFNGLDTVNVVKLLIGKSTNTGVLVDNTNSKITAVSESLPSYDELFFLLKKHIDFKEFHMSHGFSRLRYKEYIPVIDTKCLWKDNPNAGSPDDLENGDHDFFDWDHEWRPRLAERQFAIKFKQVSILSYDPPHLVLRIEANGRFNSRAMPQLLMDLAGIHSCVLQSDRIAFGPVNKDDCLFKHQMYMQELKDATDSWTPELIKWIFPFKLRENSERDTTRSRFFIHRE